MNIVYFDFCDFELIFIAMTATIRRGDKLFILTVVHISYNIHIHMCVFIYILCIFENWLKVNIIHIYTSVINNVLADSEPINIIYLHGTEMTKLMQFPAWKVNMIVMLSYNIFIVM